MVTISIGLLFNWNSYLLVSACLWWKTIIFVLSVFIFKSHVEQYEYSRFRESVVDQWVNQLREQGRPQIATG